MSETNVQCRGYSEDGIYLDAARNRYMGAISPGYGPDGKRIRRKVSGKTKQEVRAKLQALHQELNSGVRSSSTYTVREAVDDWLREGLDGTSDWTRTLYEGLLGPVLDTIGARPLRVLSAVDVRSALSNLATRYSTRSLQITRNSLERAIRHAESNAHVGTSWRVPDELARRFARLFYDSLLSSAGGGPWTVGQAVRAAREGLFYARGPDPAMTSREQWSAWAAYQHYGDPHDTLELEGRQAARRARGGA